MCRMSTRLRYSLVWLAISLAAGAGGSLLGVGFWTASVIAAAALAINGLVAEWEDRSL